MSSLEFPATVRTRSLVWFATGVALTLLATLIVANTWRADAAPGDTDTTYVPINPCRLFDYRTPPNKVGPRSTPLGAGETYIQPVTGTNGNCIIPTDAVAVAMNVTAVNPTAQSNLRIFPADVATVPLVSNLNFSAGQKPVPNKVDVKLSPDGKIKLFNAAGKVSVIGDVVGYYTKQSLTDLQAQIYALQNSRSFVREASATVLNVNTEILALTVTVKAPVAGTVDVRSSTMAVNGTLGQGAACALTRGTNMTIVDAYSSWTSASSGSTSGSIALDTVYTAAAGDTITVNLRCKYLGTGAFTALFTPKLIATFNPARPLELGPPIFGTLPPIRGDS